MPLSNLPGELGAKILSLAPGEVSDPVIVPGAVVLFLLRDVARRQKRAEPVAVTVKWADFLVAGRCRRNRPHPGQQSTLL